MTIEERTFVLKTAGENMDRIMGLLISALNAIDVRDAKLARIEAILKEANEEPWETMDGCLYLENIIKQALKECKF